MPDRRVESNEGAKYPVGPILGPPGLKSIVGEGSTRKSEVRMRIQK
jgi:hypothetical protein